MQLSGQKRILFTHVPGGPKEPIIRVTRQCQPDCCLFSCFSWLLQQRKYTEKGFGAADPFLLFICHFLS